MNPRIVLAVALSGAGFIAGSQAAPPAGFALQSLSVELPPGQARLPPGPGVETVAANCTMCHSVGMIMTQPKLARATWEAEVNKMIQVYKAPIQATNVPAIVAYLATVKGS